MGVHAANNLHLRGQVAKFRRAQQATSKPAVRATTQSVKAAKPVAPRTEAFAGKRFNSVEAFAKQVTKQKGQVFLRPGETFKIKVSGKNATLNGVNLKSPVTAEQSRDIKPDKNGVVSQTWKIGVGQGGKPGVKVGNSDKVIFRTYVTAGEIDAVPFKVTVARPIPLR